MERLISIVIPTFNEADWIVDCLLRLQPCRKLGHEVIVVDSGSDDNTVALSSPFADTVLTTSNRRRAWQMNLGAEAANNSTLLFLHADTLMPEKFADLILKQLDKQDHGWGRFRLRLSGESIHFRIIERFINLRSRLTGIATGDQALFVTRPLFASVGGFPDIPLMEDVAICKRLRQHSQSVCIPSAIITSSRRWEQQGIARTILTMWILRMAYSLGVSPHRLARHYHSLEARQDA